MDTKLFLLLAWNTLLSALIIGRTVYIMMTDKKYIGKFKRNLTYSDNVLNQHKKTCIDTSANYNAQIKRLQFNLDQMIEITSKFLIKNNGSLSSNDYQNYLDSKYEENKKLQEQYYKNKELESIADNNINMNVVDNDKNKKITDFDYVGNFINESCPICGSKLLGNKIGQKWCSMVNCKFGLDESMETKGEIFNNNKKELSSNEIQPPFIENIIRNEEGPTIITYDEKIENNDINLINPKITEKTIEKFEKQNKVITLGDLFNNSGPKIIN